MVTSLAVGVLAAVAAAVCYAVGNVLQHATVRAAVTGQVARRRRLGLLNRVVRSRRWLAGLLIAGVGTVAHLAALRLGPLFVVQPVVVCGMLIALPLSAVLTRRRQRPRELWWALVATVGLAAFLTAAHPKGTVVAVHAGRLVLDCAGALAVTGLSVLLAQVLPRRYRPTLLGLGAGIAQGTEAALQKQVVGGVAHPVTLIGWPLAALVVVSILAAVLTQVAYGAGDLVGSLPALSIANPLMAAALGAAAFGERLTGGTGAHLAQAAGVVLMAAGVGRLAMLTGGRTSPSGSASARL